MRPSVTDTTISGHRVVEPEERAELYSALDHNRNTILSLEGKVTRRDRHIKKLESENAELKRLLSEAGITIVPEGCITDGFGNVYPKFCEGCGAPNVIVRPGDCRCSKECYNRGER